MTDDSLLPFDLPSVQRKKVRAISVAAFFERIENNNLPNVMYHESED